MHKIWILLTPFWSAPVLIMIDKKVEKFGDLSQCATQTAESKNASHCVITERLGIKKDRSNNNPKGNQNDEIRGLK